MLSRLRAKKGFTLAELIATLTLMGVVTASVMPAILDLHEGAQRTIAKVAIAEVQSRCFQVYMLLAFEDEAPDQVTLAEVLAHEVITATPAVGPDFTMTAAVEGEAIKISVTAVQDDTLDPAVEGTWQLPRVFK